MDKLDGAPIHIEQDPDAENRVHVGSFSGLDMAVSVNKLYLAIPYSHEEKSIMERRFKAATRIAAELTDHQYVVFSPITHSHTMAEMCDMPTDWEFWKAQDLPYVEWADALVVIRAEGWRQSTGVMAEREYAREMGKPIIYVDPLYFMNIVGISGKKRSGKDTMGNVFEQYGFERYALADPIKGAAKEIFNFTEEQVNGDRKEEEDPYWEVTPRKVMQHFGTDAFRENYGQAVWLDSLLQKLRLELPQRAAVTDVRFPNEVWGIDTWGKVVRIQAGERLDHADNHASETALDDLPLDVYDEVVDNNGSLQQFKDKCHELAYKYTK